MHVLQLFLAHIICVKKSKYVRVQNIFHTQVDCFPSNFPSNIHSAEKSAKVIIGMRVFLIDMITRLLEKTSWVICWLIDLNN